MSLSDVDLLGEVLSKNAKKTEAVEQNMSGDEDFQTDQLFMPENILINTNLTIKQWIYPTDSFVLDHPVYGDINSATLKLDGGYDTSNPDNGDTIYEVDY